MAVVTRNIASIAAPIKARAEFHNAGRTFHGGPEGDVYKVYSYSTLVAISTPEAGWMLTGRKYSQTTGRQMSALRAALHSLGHEYGEVKDALPQY